ncbi:MAG: hypothetical protein PHH08_03710 [Candidatus ainarchaeum sp.]|nr:hypothetical protein [Candidatus ainarchaeum sp.]
MDSKNATKLAGCLAALCILALAAFFAFVQQPKEEAPVQNENLDGIDLAVTGISIRDNSAVYSLPVQLKVGIANNSGKKAERIKISLFIGDEFYRSYSLNSGIEARAKTSYEINDLVFRENQAGMNIVRIVVEPAGGFEDFSMQNNTKAIPVAVFTMPDPVQD